MKDTQPKANTEAAADQPTERASTKLIEAATKSLSRRSMFGTGLVGVLLAQACSGTDFKGVGGNNRKSGGKGGAGSDGNDGADAGGTGQDGADGGGAGKGDFPQLMTKCADDKEKFCKDLTDEAQIVQCLKDHEGELTPECKEGLSVFNNGASDAGGGGVDGADSNGGGLGDGTDQDACFANTANQVDLAGTPDADGDLKPQVKFYGRADSALIAIHFAASKADIKQIIVTTPNGKLLALHGITGADKKADGSFRPIVIDNIWLKDAATVKILIQMGADKKVHTEPVAFFNTYGGKPVKDLSGNSVPAEMSGRQSVTQFAEGATYNVDDKAKYPNAYGNGPRFLHTVKNGSTWTKQGGIMGTVTDIMGNTINIDGAGIIEYQLFCTYVDAGASVVRTILHIG